MPIVAGIVQHGMRGYYLPLAAGVLLAVSAFMPRAYLGGVGFGGVPETSGIWILVLGLLAVLLATLSVVTRKNSRHPLLLVGMMALGLEFLAWQWTERTVTEQAWATAQASAIVMAEEPADMGPVSMGAGLFVGLAAASVISLFGLTIVVRQASTPYAPPNIDD